MLSVTRRAKQATAQLWPLITARYQQAQEWAWRNPQRALWVAAGAGAVLLLVLLITHWNPYKAQYKAFAPLFTLVAGLAVAGVTLMRHFAQTEADRQRRITESFSKAVEQLAHKAIEVRLGGIYTLERISKESPDDYWTVMETLCAFVRERARWKVAEATTETVAHFYESAETTESRISPPTDIAAVLAVIERREGTDEGRLDLHETDLRGASLYGAHLEFASLVGAHLEGTFLAFAHLEDADLRGAHLERASLESAFLKEADLDYAHLERADVHHAHLERAILWGTHFGGAWLSGTHFEGASLHDAHLESADLSEAEGLTQEQIDSAFGDAETQCRMV